MKSALILTHINNLRISGASKGAEWVLMPKLHLSTDKARLEVLLSNEIKAAMGTISTETLLQSQHYLYALFSDVEIKEMFPETHETPFAPRLLLDTVFIWMRGFLRASWLLKDNCLSCEDGVAVFPHKGPLEIASSNTFCELNLTRDGSKQEECILTPNELSELIGLHDRVESALHFSRRDHGEGHTGKHSRVVRSFEFLQSARTTYSLPLRMVHYCAALEALFCTSTNELTHKLSERVAHTAGHSLDEKLQIYDVVKTAYSLRSKVVHGDALEKRMVSQIHEIAVAIDDLLRTILHRVLDDESLFSLLSGSNKDLDRSFLKRSFDAGS